MTALTIVERSEVVVPETEPQETQNEFGWEDLASTDDGRRDMGEEPVAELEATSEVQQTAETEAVQTDAQQATAESAVQAVVDQQAAGEEQKSEDEVVFTLPGGKKVTKAELIADGELLNKLVTHSNQLTHFQRLSEERKAELQQMEAEHRRMLDQYTAWQMQQQAYAQQQQQAQQPVPQRPTSQMLESAYAPYLDQLVESGRLTSDHRTEFGPLIAEYLYDHQQLRNMMASIYEAGTSEFAHIRQTLENDIAPDVNQFRSQYAQSIDQQVQQEVATLPGYDGLQDPNEWNRLKLFIQEKVNASPRLPNGRPSFDPSFDPITMAQMYDAMTGAELRQQIATERARQEQAQKQTTNLIGGETSAKAGGPPKLKQPTEKTPEQDAMDFGTPTMATG